LNISNLLNKIVVRCAAASVVGLCVPEQTPTTAGNGKILKDAIDGVIDLEKYGISIDGNGVAKILKLQ
jgi:hypothetical protein